MSIYDTLNVEQKKAVEHTEGPLLILAGAGSGKTRVLTHRIAWLIDEVGVKPWNIMAITFTNKAAGEMRERVDKIVGYGSESIWVSTFHSSCVRILRRYSDRIGFDTNFSIYDTDDQKTVMKEVCKKCQIDTKQLKERTILSAVSSAKDELITPEAFMRNAMGDYLQKKIATCYSEYQDALHKSNAFDFDDLIMKTVELFKKDQEVLQYYQNRFKYIMVDEYQDTNTAQFELIRLLADGYRNLCVVGDDDQSIYKFRGANIRNILDFESVYPDARVIKLEQNYRSTGHVLDAANAVIGHNVGRKQKSLWTDKGAGSPVHFQQFDTAYDEADYIAKDVRATVGDGAVSYKDCAVLYRTNAQSRLLEERFIFAGIPYNVVGGVNFYSRKEIKDLLAYLKTIDNGRDDVAVKRIINIPKRGIGAATIAKVQSFADENNISFFQALEYTEKLPSMGNSMGNSMGKSMGKSGGDFGNLGISGKSASKLQTFVTLIRSFKTKADEYGLSRLMQDILDTTGYLEYLKESDEEDAQDRIDNIDEFLNKMIDYEDNNDEPTLSGFLEEVALVADIDQVDGEDDRVLLMTLHSAKGLEFPHVYLAGMEDGVFPSYMAITGDDPSEIEEERRLAYVGITRAMDELTLTCARQRMVRGETQYNQVSRFVREIPEELLDHKVPARRHQEWEERSAYRSELGRSEALSQKTSRYSSYKTESTEMVNRGNAPIKPLAVTGSRKTAEEVQPFVLRVTKQTAVGSGENASSLGYEVGDCVTHTKFGDGIVKKIEPGPRDFQVTVDFEQAGTKIMYAGFAKLQKK